MEPISGRISPARTRRARSTRRSRSGSTTKKIGAAVIRLDRRRAVDRHERAAGSDQGGRAIADLATEDVEHEINLADVLEAVVFQIDEAIDADLSSCCSLRRAAGADHVRAGRPRELDGQRADTARRAVDEHGLTGAQLPVFEETLPSREPGDRERRGDGVVDVRRQRGEVACLHRRVLGEGSVAAPVRQSEDPLTDRQAGGPVAQLGYHTRQLVPGDARCPIMSGAIGPRSRPRQLARCEPGRVHADEHVVL